MTQLKGTGVAMVTPFKKDRSLDIDALERLTEHLVKGGVDFLVVLGTTGESATLTAEEQDKVIRTVMKKNAGRIPVVLGCGGNNTPVIAEKMKKMQKEYQPDAFLSVCPYYNKPNQRGLEAHFSFIAEHNPDSRIILYNVPGRTSVNMLPATTLSLARKHSQFISIKEASGNIEQMMDILLDRPAGFELLSGDDNLTLPVISAGGTGVISVMGNALPVEFSAIARSAMGAQWETAKAAHYRIIKLMGLNFAEGNPAGIKLMLSLLGICEPWVRLPLVEASDALKSEMKSALKAAGIH